MPTPSGTIGLSDVNAELGFSPTTLITMNDAAVRTLAGVPSGAISMANLQNKSNRVTISLTISANTTDYDVYSNRGPTYNAGKSDITVNINPGVTVSGTSTGSSAFRVPSAFSSGDTITIVNNGVIVGRGGGGGTGAGPISVPATNGGSGGPGLLVQYPITLQNINRIAGGGGGGGGGGRGNGTGGGGGGGGVASGSPGAGGTVPSGGGHNGSPGGAGTLSAGGNGGNGGNNPFGDNPAANGGAGGGYGSSGSSGGPSPVGGPGASGGGTGACISGNPLISYSGPVGTRNGPIS